MNIEIISQNKKKYQTSNKRFVTKTTTNKQTKQEHHGQHRSPAFCHTCM